MTYICHMKACRRIMLLEILLIIGIAVKPSTASTSAAALSSAYDVTEMTSETKSTTTVQSTTPDSTTTTTAPEYATSDIFQITTENLTAREPNISETTTMHSTTFENSTGTATVESTTSESTTLPASSSPNFELDSASMTTITVELTETSFTSEMVTSSVASASFESTSLSSESLTDTTQPMESSNATTYVESTSLSSESLPDTTQPMEASNSTTYVESTSLSSETLTSITMTGPTSISDFITTTTTPQSTITSATATSGTTTISDFTTTTTTPQSTITSAAATSGTTAISDFTTTTTTPQSTITSAAATSGTTFTMSSTTPLTTPRDPCSSNPCRNGGYCKHINSTTYICSCIHGFRGDLCEYEINECEEYPCDPFGKCMDMVNDYSCSCNSGYQSVANNTKNCTEINLCEANNTCFNGGTCVNQPELSRFYCECPPSNQSNEVIVGLRCENSTSTYPKPEAIFPNSGIIAGGARVKITGKAMDLFAPLGAYLISENNPYLTTLHALVDPNATFSDSITIISPRANDSYVNNKLLVTLEYSGPVNLTNATNLYFTYQGNPIISDIKPRNPLIEGGVQLTVTGHNMNVVEHPVMDVTTIVHNSTTNDTHKTELSQRCSPRNSTEMTCLLPPGVVPPAFIGSSNTRQVKANLVDVFPRLQGLYHSRRKKRASLANFTDPYGSTCEIYLGFVLDALPTYEDTRKSLPNLTLKFTTTFPDIRNEGVKDFNPNAEEYIQIKGQYMASGCSMADYTVYVGNETCVVHNLTDNEMLCMPPKHKPSAGHYQLQCQKDEGTLSVVVNISTHSYVASCLRYTSPTVTETNKALIIGVTVAGAVVVLAITGLVIAIVIRKKRKAKERENRPKKVSEYEKLADEGKDHEYQLPVEVAAGEESRDEAEACELAENGYMVLYESKPPEGHASSRSSADYSTSSKNETDETTVTATVHPEMTTYGNSFVKMADDSKEQSENVELREFEYEPDDPALNFDLKHVMFEEEAVKLPRLRIGGGDKKQEKYYERQGENGFSK